MKFVETSAMTNTKVQNAFQDLLQDIYASKQTNPVSYSRGALKIASYNDEPAQ